MIFPSRFSNQIKPMALIFKVNMKQNLKKKNVKKKLLCKPYLRQLAQEIGWHYTQQVLSWYICFLSSLLQGIKHFLFVMWRYLFCVQTFSNSVLAVILSPEKGHYNVLFWKQSNDRYVNSWRLSISWIYCNQSYYNYCCRNADNEFSDLIRVPETGIVNEVSLRVYIMLYFDVTKLMCLTFWFETISM